MEGRTHSTDLALFLLAREGTWRRQPYSLLSEGPGSRWSKCPLIIKSRAQKTGNLTQYHCLPPKTLSSPEVSVSAFSPSTSPDKHLPLYLLSTLGLSFGLCPLDSPSSPVCLPSTHIRGQLSSFPSVAFRSHGRHYLTLKIWAQTDSPSSKLGTAVPIMMMMMMIITD